MLGKKEKKGKRISFLGHGGREKGLSKRGGIFWVKKGEKRSFFVSYQRGQGGTRNTL